MNKKLILKVENLSKQYKLGLVSSGTIKDDLKRLWFKIKGAEDPFLKLGETNDRTSLSNSEYVWALKDINFEVKEGEVLGIIGANGAGKSTLLKILSKITAPSTGSIKFNGRVASLLEVGTGFHSELTGRENIFLNGAILGMSKKEIMSKLEVIIDFSGCIRYIDTPVKRYSSGMTVRLAFAVAAFLEPDILIIDEVLAVGDAEFQKKAIGKMQDISRTDGRTVLFVSHNMLAVKNLCSRAVLLENGKLVLEGAVDKIISAYLGRDIDMNSNIKTFEDKEESTVFRFHEIQLKNSGKTYLEPLIEDQPIELITSISIFEEPNKYHVTYHLINESGESLFSFSHSNSGIILKKGKNELKCLFPANFFQSGNYSLSLFFVKDQLRPIYHEVNVIGFTVVDAQRELNVYRGKEPGYIKPKFEWENSI